MLVNSCCRLSRDYQRINSAWRLFAPAIRLLAAYTRVTAVCNDQLALLSLLRLLDIADDHQWNYTRC